MIDYVLRVGVDGKPPLYVDGTKQYGLQARPLQFTLGVGAQIPGFDEAVLDMKVGETRTRTKSPLSSTTPEMILNSFCTPCQLV